MIDAVIFVAAILIVACAILATLYGIVRQAPSEPKRQAYRRHRPWNFK